jgi:hypothetical protein
VKFAEKMKKLPDGADAKQFRPGRTEEFWNAIYWTSPFYQDIAITDQMPPLGCHLSVWIKGAITSRTYLPIVLQTFSKSTFTPGDEPHLI